jgi:hypothetical protein
MWRKISGELSSYRTIHTDSIQLHLSRLKMKTIRTELLEIAYLDDEPKHGEPILTLHGWPHSPTGFEEISSHLHEAGFRTIAPFLRGIPYAFFMGSRGTCPNVLGRVRPR